MMARSEIAFAEIPLASPQPTAPPHPRDLKRQLDQRQLYTETCGWIDGDIASPQWCSPGSVCAWNTYSQAAAFCCDAVGFPTYCPHATTCLDSTAVAASCDAACQLNTAVLKCTSLSYSYCITEVFSFSTLNEFVTAWGCDVYSSLSYTAYDQLLLGVFTTAGVISFTATGSAAATNRPVSYVTVSQPAGTSGSTPVTLAPTATSAPNIVPTPSKSGLSGGAIAGIVVGAILLIVIILGMILLYRYFRKRNPPPPPPQPVQLNHDTTPHLSGMATVQPGSPPLSSRPSNFTMPSNAPLVPNATNEIGPEDSASNIGGPYSMVSQSPPPDVSSEVNSYPTTYSAVGQLPQFSPQHGTQPITSPGTEFGSMPPVHAPDVNPGYTFVPKGPQQ